MSDGNDDFYYPKDVRFRCTRCTLCCGDTETRVRHVLVLKKEAERISKIISRPVVAFARKIRGHGPYVYEVKKNEAGKCVFLEANACAIYTSRPLICRYYPFELRPKKNEKHAFFCTDECPGMGIGRLLKESYFVKLFQLAREELVEQSSELS